MSIATAVVDFGANQGHGGGLRIPSFHFLGQLK
jgi:hypothetical protein